ncbi:hypothetical protein L4D00_14975 [Photobacterium swingsii]|uniref:hypothetical protein n=1 Tax=Photobacterium swingsii TaxID=680026 RepID=UPI003D131D1D
MFELNFLKFMKQCFPDIQCYSFFIPDGAPTKAYCFENAGSGIATQRMNEDNIASRTIKLTFSTTEISELYDDSLLTKYIKECSLLGDIPIINARILNFNDQFYSEQKVFERTYTINFKFKG